MKSYILLTFAVLGLGWYELSGGADFGAQDLAAAEPIQTKRLAEVARADRSSAGPATTVTRAAMPAGIVLASADAGGINAAPAPKLGVTLAAPARMPLARPSPKILARMDDARETPAPRTQAPALDMRLVTGTVVNMRKGPGTGYDVIDQLRRDARVEVLTQSPGGWVKLRSVADDRVGWMSGQFLRAASN